MKRKSLTALLVATLMLLTTDPGAIAGAGQPLLPIQVSTSPPSNPELNPYGLALVPAGFPSGGLIKPGQLLVSNFNNAANKQGEGTTIISVDPNTGNTKLFFQGSATPPIGFTNALGVAKAGLVFGGSVWTTDGTPATVVAGPLLVLDKSGAIVTNLTDSLDGPWGLAINDLGSSAQLFVSSLGIGSGKGSVVRLDVSLGAHSVTVNNRTTIASGYGFKKDPTAIVIGVAGLAYDKGKDLLYVAAEDDNAIFSIPNAGKRTTDAGMGTKVFVNAGKVNVLNGPLGLILAPNGDLITANADSINQKTFPTPSALIEFTAAGKFVGQFWIDPNLGSAFAILSVPGTLSNQFAYVDDFFSNVTIWNLAK